MMIHMLFSIIYYYLLVTNDKLAHIGSIYEECFELLLKYISLLVPLTIPDTSQWSVVINIGYLLLQVNESV
jgi:hypothetical protein